MTNTELAVNFLRRFGEPQQRDIIALEALLDMAEEYGMAKIEWAFDEPTVVVAMAA